MRLTTQQKKMNRNYKYTVSRVDVVIEPGKVASGEVYFGV